MKGKALAYRTLLPRKDSGLSGKESFACARFRPLGRGGLAGRGARLCARGGRAPYKIRRGRPTQPEWDATGFCGRNCLKTAKNA